MRVYLLLQSVCSPFFRKLATALELAGHKVIKLNFTVGDTWYHLPKPALSFRGDVDKLAHVLPQIYQQYGITDQVLFGDQRPLHRVAIQTARASGITNFVFEEGYVRPFWVTLEAEGVNNASLLPRDPQWYPRAAACLSAPHKPQTFDNPFWLRALHDVLYHCGNFWNPLFYPRYRTHAMMMAPKEYMGYMWRLPALRWLAPRELPRLQRLNDEHFFVLPLQLDGDSQIRQHSAYAGMRQVLDEVVTSFGQHAPPHSHLLIKNHPLDTGWIPYGSYIKRLASSLGLSERVHYVQTGNLDDVLPYCAGVVTVNSTVGLQALQLNRPVKTLGAALYDLPGLTSQLALADFWRHGQAAEPELLNDFMAVLMHCTQLNGSLYAEPGLSLLVQQSVARLTASQTPLEELCQRLRQQEC